MGAVVPIIEMHHNYDVEDDEVLHMHFLQQDASNVDSDQDVTFTSPYVKTTLFEIVYSSKNSSSTHLALARSLISLAILHIL